MNDAEKVFKALEICTTPVAPSDCAAACYRCNYSTGVNTNKLKCIPSLLKDSLELLRIQQLDIESMRNTMQSMIEGQCVLAGNKQIQIIQCKYCRYAAKHCHDSVFGTPLYDCKHPRQIGREGEATHPEHWFCADAERRKE